MELTAVGPAMLGGVTCTAIGLLFLVWAFLAAIVSLFTWTGQPRKRVVERYSVVPAADETDSSDAQALKERRRAWSRTSSGSQI